MQITQDNYLWFAAGIVLIGTAISVLSIKKLKILAIVPLLLPFLFVSILKPADQPIDPVKLKEIQTLTKGDLIILPRFSGSDREEIFAVLARDTEKNVFCHNGRQGRVRLRFDQLERAKIIQAGSKNYSQVRDRFFLQ